MSVVAQVNSAGLPVVLPNAEGSPTTPSIVLFDAGHAVVGAVARESLATEPASVVQLVKRHIGSGWTFDYGGVAYRPEHVSALILRKVAHDAQLLAGLVTQAAITVPAYFSDPMRAATLAGRGAGRPRGAGPAVRADRGGARLRLRPAPGRRHGRRGRPRRRHLRRDRDGVRRDRTEGSRHRRGRLPGRGELRQGAVRPLRRAVRVRTRPGHQRPGRAVARRVRPGLAGLAAARRAGQARPHLPRPDQRRAASRRADAAGGRDQGRVHFRERRAARRDDREDGRRRRRRPGSHRRTSPWYCRSAVRPGCRPSGNG